MSITQDDLEALREHGWSVAARAADEIERLRAAMRPFSDAANFFEMRRQTLSDEHLIVNHESVGWQCQLSLGDLKRARSAYQQNGNKGK
jgi:hypothetical protein